MPAATIAPTGAQAPAPATADNPLLKEWQTPFGVPPFSEIKEEHYLPAIKEGMARQRQEVAAITALSVYAGATAVEDGLARSALRR